MVTSMRCSEQVHKKNEHISYGGSESVMELCSAFFLIKSPMPILVHVVCFHVTNQNVESTSLVIRLLLLSLNLII
jgi:hypothetical protein